MKKSDFNFANAFKKFKESDGQTSKISQTDEIHASAWRRMTASILDAICYIALNMLLFKVFEIDKIRDIKYIFGRVNIAHLIVLLGCTSDYV